MSKATSKNVRVTNRETLHSSHKSDQPAEWKSCLRRDQVEDRHDLALLCNVGNFFVRNVEQRESLEGHAEVGQAFLSSVEQEHEDDLEDVVDHDGGDPADDVGQGYSVLLLKVPVERFQATI